MGNAINLDYFCEPDPKIKKQMEYHMKSLNKHYNIVRTMNYSTQFGTEHENNKKYHDNKYNIHLEQYEELQKKEIELKNGKFLEIYPDLYKRVQSEVTKNLHHFVQHNGNNVSTTRNVNTSLIRNIYNQVMAKNNNFGPFRGSFKLPNVSTNISNNQKAALQKRRPVKSPINAWGKNTSKRTV